MSVIPSANSSNDATNESTINSNYNEALQRARQLANKIKSSGSLGVKRPFPGEESVGASYPKRNMAVAAMPGTMPIGGPPTVAGDGTTTSDVISVPDRMVGLIIGRGGEQITRLQSEFGCKIQMAQDSAGMPDRQCTLTGDPSAINAAKMAIERIVANEGNGPRSAINAAFGNGGQTAPGGGFFEMPIPGHKVGLIIGKNGETIKQLQEQSGSKIVIIQDSAEAALEKPIRITGPPDGVEKAKELVMEILNANDERDAIVGLPGGGRGRGRGGMIGRGGPRGGYSGRGGRGGGRGGFNGATGQFGAPAGGEYTGQATEYVSVPANKCGLVIGKGGETIKNINQSTGAHCEIDKNAPNDSREKNFIIRGAPDAVERAKNMILEKLGMGSGGYGSGGYGTGTANWAGDAGFGGQRSYDGAPGGNVPVNQQTGQPDYSAQWAEYYRSVGMIKEAMAIENNVSAAAPSQQPVAPAQPAAENGAPATANGGQQPDYSGQWAQYYRSVGKIEQAEQIEAQMKQKAQSAPYGGGQGTQAQYGPGSYYQS